MTWNAITKVSAVLVACIVGVLLDLRIEQRRHVGSRAIAQQDWVVVSDPERNVRERIESASGIRGRPLLSLDDWKPVEPVVVDGVDVSNLFAGEFIYKKSLSNDFHFTKAIVHGLFIRPEAFLDLGIPASSNSSIVLRFSSKGVEPFRRTATGTLEPVDHTAFRQQGRCSRYEIVPGPDLQAVVCNGMTVLEINSTGGQQGGVFVASNLTGGEVQELAIIG